MRVAKQIRGRLLLVITGLFVSLVWSPASTAGSPQKNLSDLIDAVRPAVVQITVVITGVSPQRPLSAPAPIQNCFQDRYVCIVGTGFLVNDTGDIVTACHVANDVQSVIKILGDLGIQAISVAGFSLPNKETNGIKSISDTYGVNATLVATDPLHDLALFHIEPNPSTKPKTPFVRLSNTAPNDGDAIFSCGFPFGEPGIVTTSGAIASASKLAVLITAASAGAIGKIFVYWVDLAVNPGNSGGPIFSNADQSVLGIVVENEGSLGIVVPSTYIIDFLESHNIRWNSDANHS